MATKRLGKGLSALIRPQADTIKTQAGVTSIPLSKIKTNPHQPRKYFDERALKDLAASIKEKGVITPITVKENNGSYILIAGERRFRASDIVNKKNIPAYIIELADESDMMEVALIENIQREDLNPIEESEAFAVLQSQFNISQSNIAKSVGKSRSAITNSLRLLQLPSEIRKTLRENKISAGHGRAILSMKTKSAMLKLWRAILDEDLSVRSAEVISKQKKKSSNKLSSLKQKNANIQKLENELISVLGTKVNINAKAKGQGTIVVDYFSNDDLDRIFDLLRSIK